MSLDRKFSDAFARHQAGDIGGAATLYRAILDEEPMHPDALHMLGVIAQQKGNTQLGLDLIDLALSHNPTLALAWYNRSLLLRAAGRPEEAFGSVRRAIELDGGMSEAYDMAGSLLRELGRLDEASTFHARAVALQPDNDRYRSNYAVLLMAKDDLSSAFEVVKDSEKLGRDSISFALGNILRAAGYAGHAIPHYRRVRLLMPDSTEAHINEAMAWLLIGAMDHGWPIWKDLPDEKEDLRSIPKWDGGKVKHLLLHEEQGLGDALQCVRYVPQIRDRAEKITLRLSHLLQKLIKTNFPDLDVITLEDPIPAVNARAQLMRLPALCGTTLATIPAKVPYLHAEESWRVPWQGRFAHLPKPRFGVVWAGNPFHRNNRNRSLTLDHLKPVLDAGREHGVSLQKWTKKDEAALRTSGLFDADPWLDDFTATAGAIMELDLVITVDTSVAHLAGALGKPVWVFIPFDPDWRWMIGREDSPWYPTMKLYRQEAPQDWSKPLARMANDLKRWIGGDGGVLRPAPWDGKVLRTNPFALDLPGLDPDFKP